MNYNESDSVRNHRIYIEVRYARKTNSQTYSNNVQKQKYINVENEKYTENLKSYLDFARSSTNLTIYDLKT